LTVGLRAHDTLTNGWIYKAGDYTRVCRGSSLDLTLHYSQTVHHVAWTSNPSSVPALPGTFTITVSPTATTEYYGVVYYDNGSPTGLYVGTVMITIFVVELPTKYTITVDGVPGKIAHDHCTGVVIGYTDSEIGATYQLQYFGTSIDVGGPIPGTGNAISLGLHPAGQYQIHMTNAYCEDLDW